jgi:hypothetical protein
LQEFAWLDLGSWWEAAPPDLSVDTVLQALTACPCLRKVFIATERASADALKYPLQLHSATDLHLRLTTDQWSAVTDEIRQGRCNVQKLTMSLLRGTVETTEAVQALASAIQMDHNLTHLVLHVEALITDEAGVALAEALTVNTSLRMIDLAVCGCENAPLGIPVYEALSAMLRVNTSLGVLGLPWFKNAGADEKLCESRDQVRIELRLNAVGRGRLFASRQTTREQWADAMHELSVGFEERFIHSFYDFGRDSVKSNTAGLRSQISGFLVWLQ